jgi:hypothetical protein
VSVDVLPFDERRTFTAPVLILGGVTLAIAAMALISDVQQGVPLTETLPWLIGILAVGAVLILLAGRVPGLAGPGDHLHVDAEGLTVGEHRLDAGRIGAVRIVDGTTASAYAAQGQVTRDRGAPLKIPAGRSTYATFGSVGRAVVVEVPPDRAWLLATRRPDELVAALEAARDVHRSGGARR